MKFSKTIRVSDETYQQILAYRADLEKINKTRISFDKAIDMLFGEVAGLEYEVASLKLLEPGK